MDRHDVTAETTAETVAQLHKEDLKIQHHFQCNGLTYWFDDKRKTAFCLIEAPNKDCLIKMHEKAHGEIPNQIIEVDTSVVESFLGRITDPEIAPGTHENLIKDPAFRTIMNVGIEPMSFALFDWKVTQKCIAFYQNQLLDIIHKHYGSIVNTQTGKYVVSFSSVTYAGNCAKQIEDAFSTFQQQPSQPNLRLKVGIGTGVPVTSQSLFFEDAIKLANRLCFISNGQIVMIPEFDELYRSENLNKELDAKNIQCLSLEQQNFLTHLMDFIEKNWNNTTLQVSNLASNLGTSRSQVYRKLKEMVGKSPNEFIKDYRLQRAFKLIATRKGNISDVAFDSGFSSTSYFSKCFQQHFGIKPSELVRQIPDAR